MNEYILGTKVNVSNFGEILSKIEAAVTKNKKITITYLTPHIANYCYRYPDFRNIINQFDIIYADGIGIVLASMLQNGCLRKRITLPDYIDKLCNFSIEKNISIYLLGSSLSVVNNTARVLKERHSLLDIAGYHAGFFLNEDTSIVEEINKIKPNVLLVGMGLPHQEKWIHKNKDILDVNVIWSCGGLFSWVSGKIRRAPSWMLKYNLEWVYRLFREPKRLWKRYLVGNPLFIFRVFRNNA